MTKADAARINGKKGGRPPGSPNRWTLETRKLEEEAMDSVLGSGDSKKAAEKLIRGIYEIAWGSPKGPDGKPVRVSVQERLKARIWLAERFFGRLPQPLQHVGKDGDPQIITVEVHPDSPPA